MARCAPYDLVVADGGAAGETGQSDCRGRTFLFLDSNEHFNSSGGQKTCRFFHFISPPITLLLTEAFCHPQRGKDGWWRREGRGWECWPPAAAEEQMLGGWHLAEAENSQTLITALNC